MTSEFYPPDYSQEYLAHVKENQSDNTYEAKKTTITKFIEYCDQNQITIDLEDKTGSIDDIYQFFKEDYLKPIPTYLSHIRSFLEYIGDQHDTETYYEMETLKEMLKKKRLPDWEKSQGQYEPEWLSDQEIEAACDEADELGEIVIRMLFETGCRRGEIAALKESDITWNPRDGLGAAVTISRTTQKTGTVKLSPKTELGYRVVELSPDTAEMLKRFMEGDMYDSSDYIFGLDDQVMYRKVKKAFTDAEIKLADNGRTKVAPHWLRHNRNTRLRKNPNISEADREQYIGNDMPKHYTHTDPDEVQGVLTR